MIIHGHNITDRELHVWRATANGITSRVVAVELGLSVKTIESHRASIYRKTGCRNMADATRVAIRHGVIVVKVNTP